MKLYRVRWQIEIAIKRWKSLLDADQLRARFTGALAEVWLHGKLLYALLIERRARRLSGEEQWDRLDREQRSRTWWRVWKMLSVEVGSIIAASESWERHRWSESLNVVAERSRRRLLQRLPPEVLQWHHPQISTSTRAGE